MPVLIALLREEETRDYRGNIVHALAEITGKDFGTDADAWAAWWRATN